MSARKYLLGWRGKLFLLLSAFAAVPALAVTKYNYDVLTERSEASTLANLAGLVRAKGEAIDQFTTVRKRDVERIANLVGPEVQKLRAVPQVPPPPPSQLPKLVDAEKLKNPNGKPPKDAVPAPPPEPAAGAEREVEKDLRRTMNLLLGDQAEFEELLLIEPSGQVLLATFKDHEGKSAKDLDYFVQGRKASYVEPVFKSPITNELTMVIATPIRDGEGELVGVLAARLNLGRFYRLITDTTGLGRTGETVAAKAIGQNLVFMAPTRHDASAPLDRRLPQSSELSAGLRESAYGASGSGKQKDYRGVVTYAAWQNIPSLDWGLLVKLDEEEARKPVQEAGARILIATVILVLLGVFASLLTARALVEPLRRLKLATDRVSRGDLAVDVEIDSNDEIGELADSFGRMVASIKFFRERGHEPADPESTSDDHAA